MRLKQVERGHRLLQKLRLGLIRIKTGEPVLDVARMILYRPELFGKPFLAYLQAVFHGPSEWSVGERELFAAFVSRQNGCAY